MGQDSEKRMKNDFRRRLVLNTVCGFDVQRRRAGRVLALALKDSMEPYKLKRLFNDFRDGLIYIQKKFTGYFDILAA